jgi:hypothetical protein
MARKRRSSPTSITVNVPVPVNSTVRTVRYSRPYQIQRNTKTVRFALSPVKPRAFVMRKVKVQLPRHLPSLAGSYVSVRRGKVNIHSRRQLRRLMEREYNRRRYQEHKTSRRHARDGQLSSMRSDPTGIVSAAASRGASIRQLGDAALVARAIIGR